MRIKLTAACLGWLALGATNAGAESVSVVDGDDNDFGNTVGLAIDFDATPGVIADWTPDLAAGSTYSVDSVTLYADSATNFDPVYLGVYGSLTGDSTTLGRATLGDFIGVSDNTVVFGGTGARTWTFSGINVVAGSEAGNLSQIQTAAAGFERELDDGETVTGDGMLFFVYQTDTTPLTELPEVLSPDTDQFRYRRIDGLDGMVEQHLAAVLQGGNLGGSGVDVFKANRSPEYDATISLVSTPTDPADLDQDGDVDDADFGLFFAAFSGPGVPTGNPAADLDGDNDTDDADFGLAFAAFTGPGGGVPAPEPTSLALLGLGGLLVARRRR